jgi:HEXXH motif-containing protein
MSHLLWDDQEIFSLRHEKSAAYLAAIRELVAEERFGGPAGEEFLRLYDRLATADPQEFTAVWSDPAAYLWVRTAYQLLGAHFGSVELSLTARTYQAHYGAATPREAAVRHLDHLKLFAAGLALRTGDDWLFERPLLAALPLALPGTRLALEGKETVRISGVRSGRLAAEKGEFELPECPIVRRGSCEIRMQRSLFLLPGIGYGEPLLLAGPRYQHNQAERLEAVLAAVERYAPQQLEQFAAHVQVAVFKPAHLGDFSNVSHSELPGAFIVTLLDDSLIMADRFIHELHHNRLFCLEEKGGAFFDDERQDSIRDPRFYSPWRDEPRPLHGLLHAFYVFQPVWHFWLRVREEGIESESTLTFADDQLCRIPQQLQLAASVLGQHGAFTEYGQAIFDGICKGAEEINSQASSLFRQDVAAWTLNEQGATIRQRSRETRQLLTVRQAIAEHLQRYESSRKNGFPVEFELAAA